MMRLPGYLSVMALYVPATLPANGVRVKMCRFFLLFVLFFPVGGIVFAQSAESEAPRRGFTFYERFEGSANEAGVVTKLDTTVGYNLTSHIAVAGGIPVYFVRPSAAATAVTATKAANGIGNVYGQFRLMTVNPALSFASTL